MRDEDRTEDGGLIQSRDDGQLHFLPGTAGATFPVTAPANATPLDEDEPEGIIPPTPLRAMKERRHGGVHLFGHPHRLRASAGDGDSAIYAIDDGARHAVIGRPIGATPDGCVYSLVARVDRATWEAVSAGSIDGRQAFLTSTEAGLSGTVEGDGVANVFDVDWFDSPSDIPPAYLPPSPFIAFTEDLPTADR